LSIFNSNEDRIIEYTGLERIMSLIHVLDEATINQIAAGEVVERPSAVVKELIENAMDAGATAITAEIKEGGLTFIRITDNGSGIAKEDIPLAFLRHATSKIRTAEDLLSVTSLGFRGEALSSIASVAQVELITKPPTSLNGYRYLIEGGEEKAFEEIGSPGGTTILVRNLFFNTPARRKFLKSAMTEAGYISDLMERLMVSHPNVSFKFIMNNQVKLQSSGNNNTKDILYQVYGRDVTKELLNVDYQTEGIHIKGFIGKPVINRGNRNFENYFINGRYIKSNVITKAVEEAYRPFLMQHKYPFTSLYYEIDPSMIDVNVHPQKLEIRLKNGEEVFRATNQAIRDTLSDKELIPKVSLSKQEETKEPVKAFPEPFEQNRRDSILGQELVQKESISYHTSGHNQSDTRPQSKVAESKPGYHVNSSVHNTPLASLEALKVLSTVTEKMPLEGDSQSKSYEPDLVTEAKNIVSGKQLDLFTEPANEEGTNIASSRDSASEANQMPFLSKGALDEHRIIGQVFSTYWLVEYRKELYIIDQHAAHEKVLYERIMAAAKNKTYASQQLLPPIVLTLSLREQEILQKREPELISLGYELEHFGGNEYSIRAVPADLYSISEKELILEFIDEMAEEMIAPTSGGKSILERVASLACKAAVKANHSFSYEEASALIKELLTLENPYHCPHGRPVIIAMSQYELERKFKRIL
jgi:DNA mismatch repair protein MutL